MDYNPDYKLIGIRIKDQRLKMKFTQEKLAEMADISTQHLSKIEKGNTKLSLPCLIALANALQTTVDHILMDSVKESKANLLKEVEAVFSDCSSDEIFLMLSQAENLKKALRLKSIL
ncbi:MAG: putative transcriptional regulator [Neobacillus sp.]|jgi:transcriptional regulator with XRE-family HTH domain|nr:putative transcriptional regulator [Neobacillus sp.]